MAKRKPSRNRQGSARDLVDRHSLCMNKRLPYQSWANESTPILFKGITPRRLQLWKQWCASSISTVTSVKNTLQQLLLVSLTSGSLDRCEWMWSSLWLCHPAASAVTNMWVVITSLLWPPGMAHPWAMWALWSTRKHHQHRSSGVFCRGGWWLLLMNTFRFLWMLGVLLTAWEELYGSLLWQSCGSDCEY